MCCPNCGHTAHPESVRCGHCNLKLPKTRRISTGPATASIACWNCAHTNPSDADRCLHCNALINAPAAKPNAGNRFSLT